MGLAKVLDEVLLRMLCIMLRCVQFASSIVILSAMGAVVDDLSTQGLGIAGKWIFIEVLACTSALWSVVDLLPTIVCGSTFFSVTGVFDVLFFGLYVGAAAALQNNATRACPAVSTNEAFSSSTWPSPRDCGLMKAIYTFSIINL